MELEKAMPEIKPEIIRSHDKMRRKIIIADITDRELDQILQILRRNNVKLCQ